MEFKLNKIDTDIRKKMQEEIKDDKVHANKGITIKKDIKQDDNISEKENKKDKDDLKEKRFYTINGVKYTKEKFQIEAEKVESLNKENYRGISLDEKK